MARCPYSCFRIVKCSDGTKKGVVTPCGICEICRKNFAHMWGTRVYHESLSYDKCCFVTLTYAPENLPFGPLGRPTIDISDIQNFLKSWREYIYPEKIRYFCGCEYSPENKLPHYHMAVFNASVFDSRVFSNHVERDGGYSVDCRFWDKGFVHVGNLEIGSSNYVAGYALKKVMGSAHKHYYEDLGIVPPRALMSRRPGIGAEFMTKFAEPISRLLSCSVEGYVTALPKYYKDKLNIRELPQYQDFKAEMLERQLERNIRERGSTIEDLKKSIKDRLEIEQQYRYLEEYHNSLVKGKLK